MCVLFDGCAVISSIEMNVLNGDWWLSFATPNSVEASFPLSEKTIRDGILLGMRSCTTQILPFAMRIRVSVFGFASGEIIVLRW